MALAQTIEIECIRKSDRLNPWERITHVGGSRPAMWRLSQIEAIAMIEAGRAAFYVAARGPSVWVEVAISRFGHKYLKTQADGEQPNNLLSLPDCI